MDLPQYKKEVDFTNSPTSIDDECQMIRVSFHTENLDKKNYQEPAICCNGKSKQTELPVKYYLSLSYVEEKSVFVYNVIGDDLKYLQNYIKNLTVL